MQKIVGGGRPVFHRPPKIKSPDLPYFFFLYTPYSRTAAIMARRFSSLGSVPTQPAVRMKPPPLPQTSISLRQYSLVSSAEPEMTSEEGTLPWMQQLSPSISLARNISVLSKCQVTVPLGKTLTVSRRVSKPPSAKWR